VSSGYPPIISQGPNGYAQGIGSIASGIFTVTLQQAPLNGDTLLLGYMADANNNIPNITAISQSGVAWTQAKTGAAGLASIWVGAVGPGAGTLVTITVANGTSGNYCNVADVFEIPNLTSSPLDQTANNAGANTTTGNTGTTPPTTQPVELIFAIVGVEGPASQSLPTNNFQLYDGKIVSVGDGVSLACLIQVVSAEGKYSSGTTISPAEYWDACIITLFTTATPPPPPPSPSGLMLMIADDNDTSLSAAQIAWISANCGQFVCPFPMVTNYDGSLNTAGIQSLYNLKQANPNILIFYAMSTIFTATFMPNWSNPVAGQTTGPLASSINSQEDLFAHDNAGNRIVYGGSSAQQYLMNIGSPAWTNYYSAWINYIVSLAYKGAIVFDGVFSDDATTGLPPELYDAVTGQAIGVGTAPNDVPSSFADNILSNVINQYQYAKSNMPSKKVLFCNAQDTTFINYLDGLFLEGTFIAPWVNNGLPNLGNLSTMIAVSSAGKIFCSYNELPTGLSNATELQYSNFAYCASLLGMAGPYCYFACDLGAGGTKNYSVETSLLPTIPTNLGPPTAAYTVNSQGIYMRNFANGLVLVNPTANSITVNLGANYTEIGSTTIISSVTLTPYSGMILITATTPITPTYFVNWAITPISGNLPFTISFSGYLSRYNNTPDTGTIVNGETIQLQVLGPGSSTWINTGITATTGPGTSGNGYFSGTWRLTEPGIYPGPWQFKAYYAGNTTKNLFGCDNNTRKRRDLRKINALIL